jgi:hypothetical protein
VKSRTQKERLQQVMLLLLQAHVEAEGDVTAGSSSSSSSQKGRPSAETLGGAFFGAGPFFD